MKQRHVEASQDEEWAYSVLSDDNFTPEGIENKKRALRIIDTNIKYTRLTCGRKPTIGDFSIEVTRQWFEKNKVTQQEIAYMLDLSLDMVKSVTAMRARLSYRLRDIEKELQRVSSDQ